MKFQKSFAHSFRLKVALAMVLSLLFVTALSNYLIYQFALRAQFEQLRQQLKMTASAAAVSVDAELLGKVPLNPDGIRSPAYEAIAAKLRQIKKSDPKIRYIYTMVKTSKPGQLRFVVDPDPIVTVRRGKNLTSFPGDFYDSSDCGEILKGFDEPAADEAIVEDPWGLSLSGYAPIRDVRGQTVALLGIDVSAASVYQTQRQVKYRVLILLLTGVLVSFGVGYVVSGRITYPIERLVVGTKKLAEDLHYRVSLKRSDELGRLATSFNEMADKLLKSRRELEDYFFRVAQSLIRLMEARAPYTSGHSDRVAEYAYKIARHMGLSQEEAELLREVAQLHDIGKLTIHEKILNKEGKLTSEEWEIIRQHPIVGQEILEPILLNTKMLGVIRSHHERHDGAGYPDGVGGDKISRLAQIVSVADAYDAMTSPRTYRQQLNPRAAMEELRRSSGTQLNPEVVEAFCQILERGI